MLMRCVCSCNWVGGNQSVLAMDWYGNETLHKTPFTNMTIGGKAVAAVQNVDNFSFACVSLPLHLMECPLMLDLFCMQACLPSGP